MPTTAPGTGLESPVILLIVLMSSIAVVAILSAIFRRGRGRRKAGPRTWIEQERRRTAAARGEIERKAGHIIASSSTAAIAGFEIIRQIEAVFTEGHMTPQDAVNALKAAAAEKGANAVINLSGQRQGTGKCAAHGDAVMVKPIEGLDSPATDTPPADDPPPKGTSDTPTKSD